MSFLDRVKAFDAAADRAVARIRSPQLDAVMYRVSSAADHSLVWHFVGAAEGLRRGDLKFAGRFASAMGIESAITNGAVKLLFERVRPVEYAELEFSHGLRKPVTSSFPSGHATAAFCAATLLGGGPAWYGAAAVVASTRVYVRLHHASDVVAGAAFGLALGYAMRPLVNRKK
jgi:undecaprenyl-diphosphatase